MHKTITIKRNGHVVEYIPIVYKCTYHQPDPKTGVCVNCGDTMEYVDGYYMVITNPKGKKICFTVDNIK